jgi:myo-inositol-1(or 4)-monophosphatase
MIDFINAIDLNLERILELRNNFKLKADNSYVSEGDLLMQSILIDICKIKYPTHFIISEELPISDKITSKDVIFIDPIDGTENFVSGLKEWGVGISVFTNGEHTSSCIYLPELKDYLITGQSINKFKSRIIGLSSSLSKKDLINLPNSDFEYRIIGCSMYNMLSAIKGSYARFENVKGVNCWDILPGLNLALEHGVVCIVDDIPYTGQILFPIKKYKIKLIN